MNPYVLSVISMRDMIAVTLGIRWIELFGENKSKMPDKMRRSRWENGNSYAVITEGLRSLNIGVLPILFA